MTATSNISATVVWNEVTRLTLHVPDRDNLGNPLNFSPQIRAVFPSATAYPGATGYWAGYVDDLTVWVFDVPSTERDTHTTALVQLAREIADAGGQESVYITASDSRRVLTALVPGSARVRTAI